ncbi:MAG: hypothetical protein DI606_10540 [Sphingobium sp.]|uniref:hypothetical protein n=1 Tax=Sphingobium sp. TaxID=1912891 RepID=UPI000DB66E0F|nr:hypothetical protein [Sphingobium sp.]PZU12110.1 MAG: hypothetical protein DI606_10540 [Sphingobium sp.]
MTNYDYPNLTLRETVEASLDYIVALIANIKALEEETRTSRSNTSLDNATYQTVDMQITNFLGSATLLEVEKTRLESIIANWNEKEAE